MQHEITIMAETLQKCSEDYMWYYVDSGASNHMTRHANWFESLKEPQIPGYVQTCDNTTHTIEHVGDIPLWEERGKTKYTLNVMHVPNLISVGQIVEQGMQVKFKKSGCFIEKHGKLIAKGKQQRRMFVLDVDMPKMTTTMFA